MSVAKVIEITASSPTSFAEAARAGVAKAAETVHGIQRAWTAALVLILLVMLLNLVARLISRMFAPKLGR